MTNTELKEFLDSKVILYNNVILIDLTNGKSLESITEAVIKE
jgi:hypothetical protein